MKTLADQLKQFFQKHAPAIIVNTNSDRALLCLKPELAQEGEHILVKFESLNERGGNSVRLKRLQGFEGDTLYFENDESNILMLQPLTLANYHAYIRPQYINAPLFSSLDELKSFLNTQLT